MVRLFDDDDTEQRLVAEFDQRRTQFESYKTQATQQQATALAAVQRRYPYAQPGVKYAIAASGMDPASPEAKVLADASGAEAVAQGHYAQPGQKVNASWF